jgi:hypothetical protein
VVGEAPCVALEVVAVEHVLETIDIPVVPVVPAIMIFPKCFQNCNLFLSLEILPLNLKENRPVIDNH